MNLNTTIDTSRLIIHLKEKWGSHPCIMCGSSSWNVVDSAYQLMAFHKGIGLALGGPVIPVVPVICGNCGNTVLVNAIIGKVVQSEPSLSGTEGGK